MRQQASTHGFDLEAQRKYLRKLTRRARLHMVWERYAPVFALSVAVLGLFIAASAAGLWERIGDPWRGIALIATLALIIRSILHARAVTYPTKSEAEMRVERDAGLSHRPIATLRDRPANVSAQGTPEPIWDAHIAKASLSARSAKATKLRPALAPRDPYFLRFIIPALLVLALMVGTTESFERLRASLAPSWQSATASQNAKFDAWIDPPDYTGRPPVYFKGKASISAPAGSEFVARVTGVKQAPRLALIEGRRTRRLTPKRLGPQSFEVRAELSKPSKARWRIGSRAQVWSMDIGADTIPMVSFDKTPEASKRDRLTVTYSASDDFGITEMFLEVVPTSMPDAQPERISIDVPGTSVKDITSKESALSLIKHPWAGKEVLGTLIAIDGRGQEGRSATETFAIPDKIFIDPLAKAVVENRSLLLNVEGEYGPMPKPNKVRWPSYTADLPELTIERAPQNVRRVYGLLGAMTDMPDQMYRDVVIFMGLEYVHQRVAQAESVSDLVGLEAELWEIAIRAEFGPLGSAREEMMAAEQDLRAGIARRARKREIDTLFSRYNDAVDRYVEYLTDNAETVEGEGGSGGTPRDAAEIQRLMDAIEEANRLGDTAGARRALTQLAELLENMKIQKTKGGEGEGDGDSSDGLSAEAKEALEDLADLTGEQRKLEDEARRQEEAQNRQGQPQNGNDAGNEDSGSESGGAQGAQQQPDPEQLARDQAALSEGLDKLEDGLTNPNSGIDMGQAPSPEEGEGAGAQEGQRPGRGGSGQSNPDAQGGSGEASNPEARPGGGGEVDPDAPEGTVGAGPSDDPSQDTIQALSAQDALEQARAAMKRAEDALERGDFAQAREAQQDAIDMLRSIGQAVVAQSNIPEGEEGGQGGQNGRAGSDPFGRGDDGEEGNSIGEGLDIPAETERQRARDLMEELRRRSAEQEREQEEREYLDRLLERF